MTTRERLVEAAAGDKSRIHICSFTDGRDYTIRVGGRVWFFEWSDRFGPLFVGARGQEVDNSRIATAAFRAVSIWKRQGMRTEPLAGKLRAIWDEPPAATYVRRGRLIVDCIEPEGFDPDFSKVTYVDASTLNKEKTDAE